MPVNPIEYSEPDTLGLSGGEVEMLLQREPGRPGGMLLGVAVAEGAAMIVMTAAEAREVSAWLAKLADEAEPDR